MSGTQCYKLLDVLCPMHIIFSRTGEISFAGPTAKKVAGDSLLGRNILDVFEIKRPREISSIEALRARTGVRLSLKLREPPFRQLKGVIMEGPEVGQMTINLSFGISIVDAVREHNLTAGDFAATDLTVEMLYLVEAKSAAMEASHQLNQRLQAARIKAEENARTDTLTGLKNRRAFDQALSEAIAQEQHFALMHVDLDFFKAVNDTLGHAAGDFVLQEVAQVMIEETRDCDTVARIGGDEFVILITGADDKALLGRIAQRIIARLEVPMDFESNQCCISASVGIVFSGDYVAPTANQLLADADKALYAAKNAGRAQHKFYSSQTCDSSKIA